MYKIKEVKLGNIDNHWGDNQSHKFIICRDGDSLIYHAKAMPTYHNNIPRNGLSRDNVLGGAISCVYQYVQDKLQIGGDSQYGGIPKELMEHFKPLLLESYLEIQPSLDDVVIDCRTSLSYKTWLFSKDLELDLAGSE